MLLLLLMVVVVVVLKLCYSALPFMLSLPHALSLLFHPLLKLTHTQSHGPLYIFTSSSMNHPGSVSGGKNSFLFFQRFDRESCVWWNSPLHRWELLSQLCSLPVNGKWLVFLPHPSPPPTAWDLSHSKLNYTPATLHPFSLPYKHMNILHFTLLPFLLVSLSFLPLPAWLHESEQTPDHKECASSLWLCL